MASGRRPFSEESKREAVKLVAQPGACKAAIARDLGIGADFLGHWCRGANVDAEVASGIAKVSAQEYERIRREQTKIRTERDILKKRARLLHSRPQATYALSQVSNHLADTDDVPSAGPIEQWFSRPVRPAGVRT